MRYLALTLVFAVGLIGTLTVSVSESEARCVSMMKCVSESDASNRRYFGARFRNRCSQAILGCVCWQRDSGAYTNCGCQRVSGGSSWRSTRQRKLNTGRFRYAFANTGCSGIIKKAKLRR